MTLPHLHNCQRILVCRPEPEATKLTDLLLAAGKQAFCMPTLEITPVEINASVSDADLGIFVSRAGARYGQAHWLQSKTPAGVALAIGPGTAAYMQTQGIEALYSKGEHDSEALLALEACQKVQGKHIHVYCSQGGRKLITKTLRERGAMVTEIFCYEATKPSSLHHEQVLANLASWQPDCLICSSQKVLEHLLELAGEQGMFYLKQAWVGVMSERTRDYAKAQGLKQVFLIVSGANTAIVEQVLGERPLL